MATHSPGPWEVTKGDFSYLVHRPGVGGIIAGVYNNEADAKLIAAAPNLLEIAQYVLAYLKHEVGNVSDQRAKEELEAAIKKATGE